LPDGRADPVILERVLVAADAVEVRQVCLVVEDHQRRAAAVAAERLERLGRADRVDLHVDAEVFGQSFGDDRRVLIGVATGGVRADHQSDIARQLLRCARHRQGRQGRGAYGGEDCSAGECHPFLLFGRHTRRRHLSARHLMCLAAHCSMNAHTLLFSTILRLMST
jgi:hypothetical protein